MLEDEETGNDRTAVLKAQAKVLHYVQLWGTTIVT